MITKIQMTDDEAGTYAYERDPDDAFKWRIRWPGLDGKPGRLSEVEKDGRDIAWQIALTVTEGVPRDA